MTTTYLPVERFGELWPAVQRSSWRWECQGHYAVDEPAVERWRAGHSARDDADAVEWRAYIEGLRERGIPFERVRMLTEPPTEYLRWMLDTTQWNVDAGEDIRWITESTARDLRMPGYDFYIFDDNRVAILHFDDAKELLGVEINDDVRVLRHHEAWRVAAWARAVPHREFLTTHGSV
jgi:hypothetical protein